MLGRFLNHCWSVISILTSKAEFSDQQNTKRTGTKKKILKIILKIYIVLKFTLY